MLKTKLEFWRKYNAIDFEVFKYLMKTNHCKSVFAHSLRISKSSFVVEPFKSAFSNIFFNAISLF